MYFCHALKKFICCSLSCCVLVTYMFLNYSYFFQKLLSYNNSSTLCVHILHLWFVCWNTVTFRQSIWLHNKLLKDEMRKLSLHSPYLYLPQSYFFFSVPSSSHINTSCYNVYMFFACWISLSNHKLLSHILDRKLFYGTYIYILDICYRWSRLIFANSTSQKCYTKLKNL